MKPMNQLDERALESLFREHYTGLCRFALAYVKQEETAREIVQDAFVSLWDKRETIDLERSVKSYLSTSVRNKCLNHLRDSRKYSRELLELENIADHAVYVQDDRMALEETRRQIAAAIGELPEKCREVFLLSRNQHMKYQEIAESLGISVKTVETQMSKALAHLRQRLSGYFTLLGWYFLVVTFC